MQNNISSSFWKIFILATALTLLSASAQALDAPHNVSFATGCLSCHDMTSNAPNLIPTDTYTPDPGDIDHTLNNSVCEKCHIDAPDGTAPYMPTHSSQQTDESYGQWTVECRVCHNQHSQDQFKNYGTASYVYTGTNGGVNNSGADAIITVTGPAMTPDQYAGYIVVPNTARLNYNYKIIGNTVDTLTVEGSVNTTYAATGSQLAISYGKFIRSSINLANIGKTGSKAVRFFRPTGPNSFADGTGLVDGICEVCHTKTSHWRNDGSFAAVGVHDGLQATNCMSCHPHSEGFKADCGACHGFPPEDNATLVASPGPTGSATAGAHIEHTTNQAIGCDACHYKNIPDGEHNNGAPLSVTIGFGPNAPIPQGGSYDGQALVPYDRTTTTPETTVSNTGSKTCSALYCHGNYAGSGLNASPVWDNPATGDCGTCHLATNVADNSPKSGGHEKHADVDRTINGVSAATYNRGYKCTLCHAGLVVGAGPTYTLPADKSKHVNGLVEWAFDATDARVAGSSYGTAAGTRGPTNGIAPNQTYSTCSNVYCHSIVQTATGGALTADTADYKTPVWRDYVGCGYCHNQDGGHASGPVMNSGSHTGHLAYWFTASFNAMKCEVCHRYGTEPLTAGNCTSCHLNGERTDHSDGEIDVKFATEFTGAAAAYNGTPAPGDGYSTCASTYCHGTYVPSGLNATPTWGTAATGACGTCHGASNTTPPADAAASTSHRWHAAPATASQDTSGYSLNCGTCHNSVVDGNGPAAYTIASKTLHVNKAVDWQFDTTDTRVSASSAYSIASASQAPSDGVSRAYGTCSLVYCHSNGQTDGGGAPDYKTPQWGVNYSCGDAVTGCHPVDPVHNSAGPRMSSGSHTAHLAYTFNLTTNRRQCTTCHKWNQSAPFNSGCTACHSSTDAHTARNTYHINKEVDLRFETAFTGAAAVYNGSPAPGDGYANCSTTYCHGDGTSVSTGTISANTTPDWGSGPLTCASCHDNGPAYANDSPKANNHPQHIAAGITCDKCHYDTTTDGTTIASKANHVNRAYNVTPNSGAGISFAYTYSATGGSCATNGCHIDAIWGHTHNVQYNAAVDTSQPSVQGCADCHNDSGGSLATWADIMAEHNVVTNGAGSCATCHNSARNTGIQAPFTSVADVIDSSTATVTCTVCHDDKTPDVEHGYLPHDDASNRTVVTWTGASGAGTDPDCKVCHDDGSVSGEVVYSTTTHGGDCALCHASIPNPLQGTTALATAMPTGTGAFNDGGGSCVICHAASYAVHTVNSADQATSLHDKVSLTYAAINGCDACHGGIGSLDTWLEIVALHGSNCATCHDSDHGDVVAAIQAGRSDANGFTGGNTAVDCDDCHITDTDAGVSFNVDDAVTPMGHGLSAATVRGEHNMFSTSGITGVTDCANCHDMGATDVVANFQKRIELHTSPVSGAANSCLTCHNGQGDPANAQIAAGIGGAAVNCNGCHNAKGAYTLHGLTEATVDDVHDKFGDSNRTAEKYCGNCHITATAANRLDLHVNCLYCHDPANTTYVSPTPTTNGATAPTVVNNGRSTGGNLLQTCENCHAAKADYFMHGLTDDNGLDGVADVHDKLTDSTGITPTFTNSKILIEATQYSCYQCHEIDQGAENVTAWTKRIQVHTSASGTGSGTCLTCHIHTDSADEITLGRSIGGHLGGGGNTAIDCENCHDSGNGPSGKAMYQYDGTRHHATTHAQAGDCTWCHADPRPATVDQDPGWADTAYGSDSNYATGWMNSGDYNLTGFTLVKQFACRLCHTNYDTTDLQGTTRTTTGLIVYKNVYVPTRYIATNSQTWGVNGDTPTTQTAMASHTIPRAGGKVQVENYGACLSCHSVQVWHAKPTWNKGGTSSTTNGVDDENDNDDNLFDALRQAPGRSYYNNSTTPNTSGSDTNAQKLKFNIFATGTNTGGVAKLRTYGRYNFGDSGKPYKSTTSETRGKEMYKDYRDDGNNPWISNIPAAANTARTIIPNHTTITDGENLMSSNPSVPYFTNVPVLPAIDEITVTSAVWNGTTLSVEWSSSLVGRTYTLSESTGTCSGFAVSGTGPYTASCNSGFAYPATGVPTITITSNAAGGGTKTASITNTESPGTIKLSAATYTVAEDGTSATITVRRSGGSKGAVGISYATSNGTATAGTDYTSASGTLSWAAGISGDKTFTIPISDDGDCSGSETVNIAISDVTGGASLGSPNTAELTITPAETPGTLQFSSDSYSGNEDDGAVTITVTRTGGTDCAVSVNYATADDTATLADSDYTAASGTMNWSAGDNTSRQFTVTPTADTTDEPAESVDLNLSNPSIATLGSPAVAALTIVNDDSPGTVNITTPDASVAESVGTVTITASRTGGNKGAVTATVDTAGSTATGGGTDYSLSATTFSWADGDTADKTITITVTDDGDSESEEIVVLTITTTSGGLVKGNDLDVTTTITDDDCTDIAVQNSWSSQCTTTDGGTNSLQCNSPSAYTITAGSNRLLVVAVLVEQDAANSLTFSNIQWNNTNMIPVPGTFTNANRMSGQMFYLNEANIPDADTSATIEATVQAGGWSIRSIHTYAMTFTNVDQITPIGDAKNRYEQTTTAIFSLPSISYGANDKLIVVGADETTTNNLQGPATVTGGYTDLTRVSSGMRSIASIKNDTSAGGSDTPDYTKNTTNQTRTYVMGMSLRSVCNGAAVVAVNQNFAGAMDGTEYIAGAGQMTPGTSFAGAGTSKCWYTDTGTTASPGTGLTSGNPAPYIYRESSNGGTPECGAYQTGDTFWLESPDLDGASYNYIMSFDWNYESTLTSNYDTLAVYYSNNGTAGPWTLKQTIANARRGTTAAWASTGSIDLSSELTASNSRVRIVVTAGQNSYLNDTTIDNIKILGY